MLPVQVWLHDGYADRPRDQETGVQLPEAFHKLHLRLARIQLTDQSITATLR